MLSDADAWRYARAKRHDVIVIPTFWVALFLSLHFHAAMLWFWLPRLPQPHLTDPDVDAGKAHTVLVARLAPTPAPPAAAAPPPSPPPQPAPPPRAAAPPARRPPPTPVRPPPAPSPLPPIVAPNARPAPPPPTSPPVAPPAPPPPPATDLASYIEAQRRARGVPTTTVAQGAAPNAPPQSPSERLDSIIAGNLANSQQPTFGYDPKSGGGVFQLKEVGYEDASFYFTGWDKDIGRRAKQLIEVRRGKDGDIRVAIVRRMIAIIRDEVKGDFTWKSDRLGRLVVMSARPDDNAALEEFLTQEFFSDQRRAR